MGKIIKDISIYYLSKIVGFESSITERITIKIGEIREH